MKRHLSSPRGSAENHGDCRPHDSEESRLSVVPVWASLRTQSWGAVIDLCFWAGQGLCHWSLCPRDRQRKPGVTPVMRRVPGWRFFVLLTHSSLCDLAYVRVLAASRLRRLWTGGRAARYWTVRTLPLARADFKLTSTFKRASCLEAGSPAIFLVSLIALCIRPFILCDFFPLSFKL